MGAPTDFSALDNLLTKALAKQTPKAPRRKASDSISPEELARAERRIKERFTDPANWERTRNVVLIHHGANDEETLLGNFVEYKHKLSVGICRKLIRDETPALVGEIEYVTGNNWHERAIQKPGDIPGAEAESEQEAIVDLHLPELDHVFAPTVMVTVKLLWGGIARVELFDETRFFSKDKRIQLILPAGLDVLNAMSMDSKLALRKFLGL